MFSQIDFRQVAVLTRFTLKSEWRLAGARSVGRRRKPSSWLIVWTLFSYVFIGLGMVRPFLGNADGPEFITAAGILFFYASLITASNIFLSFGSGFLSPDEATIISPLPVSSETFFFSRLTVLLSYTTLITLTFILPPAITLVVAKGMSVLSAVILAVAAVLCTISAALAVIAFYGVAMRRVARPKLMRTMGYVQFIGSFLTALTFVILPRLEHTIDLSPYTIVAMPTLKFAPPLWFASIVGVVRGILIGQSILLAGAAVVMLGVVSASAHLLLAKNYQTDVQDITLIASAPAKPAKVKREPAIFRGFSMLLGSHESRAVLMLLRAQFRHDSKFRMGLFASLPITLLYLIIAIFDGGIRDPFTGDLRSTLNAAMLYLVALLMPLLQMQSVSQSDNFKASWIFFSSPLDRAKLLLAVRNTLVAWIMIPYMIVMGIVFSFYMPIAKAAMHVMVLAAIAGLVFQLFLMIAPKMPFAQRRRTNRTSFPMIVGIFFFAAIAMGLLAVEVHWGYRTPTRFWISFYILAALTILMEQLVRYRVSIKLAKEEFEG